MSTDTAQNTNRLILDTSRIFDYIESADIENVNRQTEVDWERNLILRCEPGLRKLLLEMQLASEQPAGGLSIAGKGKAFLGKLLLGLDDKLHELVASGYPVN